MLGLDRITHNPQVMGGKACIRVTAGMIVRQVAAGHTQEEILSAYPYLEREDIAQALQYAALMMEERSIELTEV